MANSLVEGPIPLSGRGFIAKDNGNFQPGEYKRLSNVEVSPEGIIVNRRNVHSVHGESAGSAVSPITNPQRFMGNMGEHTLLTDGPNQYIVNKATFVPLWNTFAGPSAGASYSRFLGFFRYNNKNFWLVFEYEDGISVKLVLYHDASIPIPDVPSAYGPGYQASLTRTVILSFATGTNEFYQFQFKNFFLYKERLWIATSVGLYFSAATNPLTFTVPDGGFFKFPGNVINWAFAIKDNIYILNENSVHSLTYSSDPNLDSTVRPLSDSVGGDMGCNHLDTPYFINNSGIYVINSNNIDKVIDNHFDTGSNVYHNRLVSFEDYLVVNKYDAINYDNNYSPPEAVSTRRNLWRSPESDAVGGTQIITGWTSSGSPALTTRVNKAINPSVEIDPSTGYVLVSYNIATMGRTNSFSHSGGFAGYVERNDNVGSKDVMVQCSYIAATPDVVYTSSVYVRVPQSREVSIEAVFLDASGNRIINDYLGRPLSSEVTYYITEGVWTRISVARRAPAGTVNMFFRLKYIGLSGTSRHLWDSVLVEETSQEKNYFDGDYPDDTFKTYSWAGAQHTSTSSLAVKTSVMDAVAAASDGQTGKVLDIGGTIVDKDDLEGATPDVYGEWKHTYDSTGHTALVSGVSYTFRFSHRGVGAWTTGGYFDGTVEYLDAANVVLGSSSFTVSNNYLPSDAYGIFEINNLTCPVNTVKLKFNFKLKLSPVSSGVTPWSVHINRLHLEQTSSFSGYFTGATTDTVDVLYNWAAVAFASESFTSGASTHGYLKNNGYNFDPFQGDNTLGYNTFFINTLNGAVHVLDFADQYDAYSHGGAGFIVDVHVNPYDDSEEGFKLFFITNKAISETESGLTYKGNVYYLSNLNEVGINDFVVDTANVLRRTSPKIDIEIDSFVPDGHEYRVKKFRSLLLQGVIPPSGMQLETSYDNTGISLQTELGDNEAVFTNPRRHYAHRFGLNQRARSITLRLRNLLWNNPIADPFGELEISDIRVLWTPTQKLPSTKNIGS